MNRLIAVGFLVSSYAVLNLHQSHAQQAAQFLEPTPTDRGTELKTSPWIKVIEREIPPLQNDPGERLPMIMWHGVGFDVLSDPQIKILRDRGLCQHLPFHASAIPAALALQKAGMPVILMEGRTDSWPYSLDDNPDEWSHELDATFKRSWFGKDDAFEWHGACPHKTAGWKVLQKQTRETMQKFRDEGVTVTGVWMDYEGDPYPWKHSFDQIKACRRCRNELPSEIVNNEDAWRDDAWQRYVDLYDRYFAAPIREVFPDCLVTNWHVVFSTKDHPVRYFVRDTNLPALSPKHFSATNPIAYGSDVVWHARWSGDASPTQDRVDAFYHAEILQQVSTDRVNREALGKTSVVSIPWVARFCKLDTTDRKAPIMTRESYREALVEVWKQGVLTMQVFNAMHDGFEELAITELKDAVLAYDASIH